MPNLRLIKEDSPEARLTRLLARYIASNQDFPEIKELIERKNIKWERFNGFMLYHELYPFGYACLEKYIHLLPAEETDYLRKNYYFNQIFIRCLWQEFLQAAGLLDSENIKFVPLKGIAFLADNLYGDKGYLRPMSDIDLLARESDLPLIERLLETLGYQRNPEGMREKYWKKENYHFVFTKEIKKNLLFIIEVHWALDYKRERPQLPKLWDRIRKARPEGREIRMLSPEDMLFGLALHQRRFGKMLCLKNVCDLAMLLDKYGADFDWDYILKEAKSSGMSTTLYFVFAQVNLLFDTRIPAPALEALGIPGYKKRLIKGFIARDTFSPDFALSIEKINLNNVYLKSHFLIYDNFWEPVRVILNAPQEQFAKFYKLNLYGIKTNLLYRMRYFCFAYTVVSVITKLIINRLASISGKIFRAPYSLIKIRRCFIRHQYE